MLCYVGHAVRFKVGRTGEVVIVVVISNLKAPMCHEY